MKKFINPQKFSLWLLFIAFTVCMFNSGVSAEGGSYKDILRKACQANRGFADSPICDIALLAAHDSMSDQIKKESPVNPADTSVPQCIAKLPVVREVVSNYSKAQSESISRQLELGVRYIDARITCYKGVYYTYHSKISEPLSNSLVAIINFLIDNPGEFIVFDIVKYKTKECSEQELADYISRVQVPQGNVSYNLYDFINYDSCKDINQVTYNDVTCDGMKGGVVIVANDFNENALTTDFYKRVFKNKEKHSVWHNENDSSKIMSKIDYAANECMYNNYRGFRCNQVQTSPGTFTIVKAFFDNSSLISNAENHNAAVINHPHLVHWMAAMPIIQFDNVTTGFRSFNDRIQTRILFYNCSLNNNNFKKERQCDFYKITDQNQLGGEMRVILKDAFSPEILKGNSLKCEVGGTYMASDFQFNSYDPCQMWKFIDCGSTWKMKMADGRYLKISNNCFSKGLTLTNRIEDGTNFTLEFCDGGNTVKIYQKFCGICRGLNIENGYLKCSGREPTKFTLYTPTYF